MYQFLTYDKYGSLLQLLGLQLLLEPLLLLVQFIFVFLQCNVNTKKRNFQIFPLGFQRLPITMSDTRK